MTSQLPSTRQEAAELDSADPLSRYREEFISGAGGPIYLDGNSLGRQPRATRRSLGRLLDEWASNLVRGWDSWADLPTDVGDQVGELVGAARGEVVACDSTTLNLYKLAAAAVGAKSGRNEVVGDVNDFPTVRYVLQAVTAEHGLHLVPVASDPVDGFGAADLAGALTGATALVCLSGVNYRSGAVADMKMMTQLAHRAGALTLWDLSHAAGVLPVELDATGADLAVGCGYKYLNGGPGAPAWLYVRADLQQSLCQPVWGWWGQRDQFEMGADYEPAPGVRRFLTGTPDVLGLTALAEGIAPLVAAGVPALWAKTQRLVAILAARAQELLAPLGVQLASPRRAEQRGGHLALSHRDAWTASQLLIDRGLVVADFREPDVIRLAPVAIYTSYLETWDAVERIASVFGDRAVRTPWPKKRVT
ncbi:MAG TPA: aminotransferase class V-fold PLP-dependent enzyme [Acidimicrobiales bacterium]|nr:aminotransferase class V-fold PLP-dependent enzyme [Acidimicrobiales bacterium]